MLQVVSTLLAGGFTVAELGRKNLHAIEKALTDAFAAGDGLIGFGR